MRDIPRGTIVVVFKQKSQHLKFGPWTTTQMLGGVVLDDSGGSGEGYLCRAPKPREQSGPA